MTNSFSQKTQLTCPKTNHPFEFEVWLIIDCIERPDLIGKVKAGTLHKVISPFSGNDLENLDVPLLIYQSDGEPYLLFSPAENTTPEQVQQQVTGLIGKLRQSLGETWQDSWLQSSFGVIPRFLLSEALDNYKKAQDKFQQTILQSILGELNHPLRDVRDIPRRIQLYQQALTILRKEDNEQLWAKLHNDLGNHLGQNPLGNHAENLEQAIYHFKQTLFIFTCDNLPELWAGVQHNLANAYSIRIIGNRAKNLEQAIRRFKKALLIYTFEDFPELWAASHNSLGASYTNRILGNRADNLDQAIDHLKQALLVRTQTNFPEKWAMTHNNLADAYNQRINGSRADNIEKAINHCNQALLVRSRENFPIDWATTEYNLANAYINRILGSRVDNIEQAIYHYEHALEVYTCEDFPERWSGAQNGLASAYSYRIVGNRAKNVEKAIYHFKLSLLVRSLKDFPEQWAATQNNLAATYNIRIVGNRAENLERAIHRHNKVLRVFTYDNFPIKWAGAQHNLGTAYNIRIVGNRVENFEQAIHHFNEALRVFTYSDLPTDWATTQNSLAVAYNTSIVGNRAENLERAIHHFNEALRVFTFENFPLQWTIIQNNLAALHFDEQHWQDAYNIYRHVVVTAKQLLAEAPNDAARQNAVSESAMAYLCGAYAAVQLQQFDIALQLLEAGKARLLAETLALGDANLGQLADDERQHLQSLRGQVQDLDYEYRLPADTPMRRAERSISADLRQTRSDLRDLIAKLQQTYPDFMPEGLPIAHLLSLIPQGGALVALLFTSAGSAIFVIPQGVKTVSAEHVILLNDFNLGDLYDLTRGTEAKHGWIRHHFDYRFHNSDLETLFDSIETTTHRLWDILVSKIYDKLVSLAIPQQARILFMPQGDSHVLPIHAAWRMVDDTRRYFIDEYTITYTPSMTALTNAARHREQGSGALVVGVSEYSKMNDLANTRIEADAIADLLGTKPLLEKAASAPAVKYGVTGKEYIHLCCHGGFAWGDDVFSSALYVGNDETLPLSEIMAKFNLDGVRLVVLSACETGIIEVRNIPDEFLGLPAGFIQAGAGAVISSLWSVADLSTSLLMERLYLYMLNKDNLLPPAQALRQAQFWLRNVTRDEIKQHYIANMQQRMSAASAYAAHEELRAIENLPEKPFAHPYYWAAFTYNGLL
jgi:CHAT domain-containing protein